MNANYHSSQADGISDPGEKEKGIVTKKMPKFPFGRIVATPNALNHLTYDDMAAGLMRHLTGDWGDVDAHDRQENEISLHRGFRLFSVYHATNGVKFWIITEADRLATTFLLPEDY
jgi:hypothetical protein